MRHQIGTSMRFSLRPAALGSIVAVLALGAAGCGGSSSQSGVAGAQHTMSTLVTTRTISGLGTVLVNAQGRTLYAFTRDQHQRVTCTGSCAAIWLAQKLSTGQKPNAGGAARAGLLGSDKNPAGGNVITYAKWPLYTYTGDTGAGTANGEGLNLNGGRWYVVSPSGMLIKTKQSSGAGATSTPSTTGGGGGGY